MKPPPTVIENRHSPLGGITQANAKGRKANSNPKGMGKFFNERKK